MLEMSNKGWTVVCCMLFGCIMMSLVGCDTQPEERRISKAEYQDKVAASWYGQLIGNMYGLSYEFKFLEEPGPDDFPYGYGPTLDQVRDLQGAFSDDDTDIEYMSLLQMEKHGPEPTYRELTAAWKYHIRDRIWAANRVALNLMHHGYFPPATGDSTMNARWFEIDPQLVNEIWSVTAPGMVDYAVQKTDWASRITNDSFGVQPAMFYAAMYAEAFFSRDIEHLIETGLSALGEEAHFSVVVREMIDLHRTYPDRWQDARKELRDRYYVRQPYNKHGWEPIDATLNGAAAILALLYGKGDIWRTLDLASAMGFDADNQAATMTGLLALSQGSAALPQELLFPLEEESWTMPFNDRYINITRYDLPDASISDMINRLAHQGEKVILLKGGRIELQDEEEIYVIPSGAAFTPPFEALPTAPVLAEVGQEASLQLYASSGASLERTTWDVLGTLPAGVTFKQGAFSGRFEAAGDVTVELIFRSGQDADTVSVNFLIRSPNMAGSASSILHNDTEPEADLERLRDGRLQDPAFVSASRSIPFDQWYGYAWKQPVSISRVGFHNGFPDEEWGWLKNVQVEYLTAAGSWNTVDDLVIDPPMPAGDSKYLHRSFVGYDLRFQPVLSRGIRITGTAGGHPVDAPPRYGSIISEITVHSN